MPKINYAQIKVAFPGWNSIINWLSFLIALIALGITCYNSTGDKVAIAVIYIFGFYIFIIALISIWRELAYSRKARYAEAGVKFHKAIHSIRDAYNGIDKKEEGLCVKLIQDSLSFFASAFSLITSVSCRSSIKIINCEGDEKDGNNYYTLTFARGSTVYNSSEKQKKKKDRILDNSDFFMIFNSRDYKNFFCNDLTKVNGYQNSHWPYDLSDRNEFIKNKKYKYISTIIWPIRNLEGTEGTSSIIGFLCIDSKEKGVFEQKYDIDFGAIFADTLYRFLEAYRITFSKRG